MTMSNIFPGLSNIQAAQNVKNNVLAGKATALEAVDIFERFDIDPGILATKKITSVPDAGTPERDIFQWLVEAKKLSSSDEKILRAC
jgi:hypothetical protein